jgi:serine acetyltransferase
MLPKLLRTMNIVCFGADIQPEADNKESNVLSYTAGIGVGQNVQRDENCTIFQGVTITPGTHPGLEFRENDALYVGRGPDSMQVPIYGKLPIGPSAAFGVNAVVLTSGLEGVTVAGIPARVVINS